MTPLDQEGPTLSDGPNDRARRLNVGVCMYLYSARAVQYAVASADFLDTYIMDISGSNQVVGQIESLCGVAALLILLPCGYLADHCKRLGLLRILAIAKALPVMMTFVGVREMNLQLLRIALVLLAVVTCSDWWGCVDMCHHWRPFFENVNVYYL